jgi:transposase
MSTPNYSFIGIDVGKSQLDAARHDSPATHSFSNTPEGLVKILTWIQDVSPALVAVEASGGYERALVHFLSSAGIQVAVVSPNQVLDFARAHNQKAKTDKLDAHNIAYFASIMKPRVFSPPSPVQEKLLALVTRRRQIAHMIIPEKNRLMQACPDIRPRIQEHIDWLEEEEKEIEEKMRDLINSDPDMQEKLKILSSAKGVGDVSAFSMLAELPEMGTIGGKQISALLGVAPFNRDSGKKKGKRRTGGGRYNARSAFYMATLSAIRWNPVIKRFYERLLSQGKEKKVAIVACMRKFIVILNAMLRDRKPFIVQSSFG